MSNTEYNDKDLRIRTREAVKRAVAEGKIQ
jgi:hypothetical protein